MLLLCIIAGVICLATLIGHVVVRYGYKIGAPNTFICRRCGRQKPYYEERLVNELPVCPDCLDANEKAR